MLLVIALIILSFALYKWYNATQYFKEQGIKHDKPSIFFGHMKDSALLRRHFLYILDDFYKKFKNTRYFGIMFIFLKPTLVVKDLELIKKIGIKDFEHFTDHQQFPDEVDDRILSENLFFLKDDKWRKMRSTLSPSFTGTKMKIMFDLISSCSESFVQFYIDQKDKIFEENMKNVFTRYANDIIASCAFGIECDSQRNKTNEFYMRGSDITNFKGFKSVIFFAKQSIPKITRFLRLKLITRSNEIFFQNLIKDTINARQEKGIVRPDMIHLLLEARKGTQNHNPDETLNVDTGFSTAKEEKYNKLQDKDKLVITDEDIFAQALVFFFAGFETTSTLMSFLAYEMAVHKDIQDKVSDEIEEAFRNSNGKISYEAVMKLKYLDMVISETLRKWPPTGISERICVKDYKIPARNSEETDILIKKGSQIWIPMYSIHRDPDYFPEPDKFDPERFNDENRKKIDPLTYIPFGMGPRNCIGSRFALMQTKMIIFHLLKSFEIVPVEKTMIPLVLCKNTFNLDGDGGIWLGFKKRQS